jgi:RNA polymerase sigma-70 factor (ECF subfamily)
MNPDLQDDLACWMQRSDQAAARRVVQAILPQITAIVNNHLPRGTDVDEVVQEVVSHLFKKLHLYSPSYPFEPWLSRVALNTCLGLLRKRKARPEWRWSDLSEQEQLALESLSDEERPETHCSEDYRGLLGKLLDGLSAKDRLVVTMIYLEEKSAKETAQLLGWSSTLVRVRAFRAMQKMRLALQELEKEPLGDKNA